MEIYERQAALWGCSRGTYLGAASPWSLLPEGPHHCHDTTPHRGKACCTRDNSKRLTGDTCACLQVSDSQGLKYLSRRTYSKK